AVGEPAQPGEVRQGHALRNLGVEIEFSALPGARAERGGPGERIALLPLGDQAVRPGVRGAERILALPDVGRLELGAVGLLVGLLRAGADRGERENPAEDEVTQHAPGRRRARSVRRRARSASPAVRWRATRDAGAARG